jgi:hypothetical protein
MKEKSDIGPNVFNSAVNSNRCGALTSITTEYIKTEIPSELYIMTGICVE